MCESCFSCSNGVDSKNANSFNIGFQYDAIQWVRILSLLLGLLTCSVYYWYTQSVSCTSIKKTSHLSAGCFFSAVKTFCAFRLLICFVISEIDFVVWSFSSIHSDVFESHFKWHAKRTKICNWISISSASQRCVPFPSVYTCIARVFTTNQSFDQRII